LKIQRLEGKQCVLPALQNRLRRIQMLYIKQGLPDTKISDLLTEAQRQNIPVQRLPKSEIEAMAFGKTHGGVLALCSPKRAQSMDEIIALLGKSAAPLLLLLEGVEDSQNLGYVLRSAEALGVTAVLLKKHLWDFDETAVSRASSGSYERLPMVKVERASQELETVRRKAVKIWGCIANAKRTCYEVDLTGPIALAIGGEKRGLSAAVREKCDGFLRIPMAPNATSLSMSHAASILLAEVMRQRLEKARPKPPSPPIE
jgi:23S rRNA (guanosine2251-2'-O)-methyltransferase